jgi:hypothetical protein
MPLPTNRRDLEAFGYQQLPVTRPGGAHCSACNAPIEWWLTPRYKKMPFRSAVINGVEQLIPHFSDCPKAQEFKKKKRLAVSDEATPLPLTYSDSELMAMGFSRLSSLDRTCGTCHRAIECWEDRIGNKCPFLRDEPPADSGPRVIPHFLKCRAKIYFHAHGERSNEPRRDD